MNVMFIVHSRAALLRRSFGLGVIQLGLQFRRRRRAMIWSSSPLLRGFIFALCASVIVGSASPTYHAVLDRERDSSFVTRQNTFTSAISQENAMDYGTVEATKSVTTVHK